VVVGKTITSILWLIFSFSHLKTLKGVVHFKKKTFADNLLTPISPKMSMSFFLQSKRN